MCELMLLCGLLIGQAEAPSADLKRSVIRLVDQMDSNLAAERDAAEKKILDLGPDVLSVLPDPNPRFSSEVNNRLRRIRLVLERRRAEATVEPSRVTLTAEKLPLSEVFAAIEKQTGNAVLDYRERLGQQVNDPELTLKFEKTPFWTALDEVLEAAELVASERDGRCKRHYLNPIPLAKLARRWLGRFEDVPLGALAGFQGAGFEGVGYRGPIPGAALPS